MCHFIAAIQGQSFRRFSLSQTLTLTAQVRQRHFDVLACLLCDSKYFFTFFINAVAGGRVRNLFQFHVAHFDISLI